MTLSVNKGKNKIVISGDVCIEEEEVKVKWCDHVKSGFYLGNGDKSSSSDCVGII